MIEFHYWPTPNGHKVTLLLEEAGLESIPTTTRRSTLHRSPRCGAGRRRSRRGRRRKRAYALAARVNPDAGKPLSDEERKLLFGQGARK